MSDLDDCENKLGVNEKSGKKIKVKIKKEFEKPARNGYFLFCRTYKPVFIQWFPNEKYHNTVRRLAKSWKTLQSVKDRYNKIVEKQKKSAIKQSTQNVPSNKICLLETPMPHGKLYPLPPAIFSHSEYKPPICFKDNDKVVNFDECMVSKNLWLTIQETLLRTQVLTSNTVQQTTNNELVEPDYYDKSLSFIEKQILELSWDENILQAIQNIDSPPQSNQLNNENAPTYWSQIIYFTPIREVSTTQTDSNPTYSCAPLSFQTQTSPSNLITNETNSMDSLDIKLELECKSVKKRKRRSTAKKSSSEI